MLLCFNIGKDILILYLFVGMWGATMIKARKKLMNESFEIKGIWYLPDQDMQKNGVQGILKYSPERIVLDLIGTFQGETDEIYFSMRQSPEKKTIYGFTNYGERITLCDCFPLNAQMSAPGFDTISYVVNWFFAGTQYINSGNEKIIEDCTFSFTYLDAWLNLRIMNMNFNRENGNVDISIDLSRAIEQKKTIILEAENVSLCEEVFQNISFPKEYYSEETTKIVFNRFYRLSSKDGRLLSYDECFDILHKLRKLLTLLIGNPLYILYIDLNLPVELVSSMDGEQTECKHFCRAFFTQVGDINKLNKISPYKPNSILISREDIKNCIENVFGSWFLQQDKISEIANPYVMDFYLPTYQENRFLNIVRCLEAYHRTFFNISVDTEAINDVSFENSRAEIIAFINATIPIENRQNFLDRVNYEDESSLQKRLKDVMRKTPRTLMNRLFGDHTSKDINTMAQRIAQTRNYYTHRDKSKKYPMAIDNREELDLYIRKLAVILQFWVLSCIGIEQKTIEKRLVEFDKNQSAFC